MQKTDNEYFLRDRVLQMIMLMTQDSLLARMNKSQQDETFNHLKSFVQTNDALVRFTALTGLVRFVENCELTPARLNEATALIQKVKEKDKDSENRRLAIQSLEYLDVH